ncbi:hypothetical protein CKO12_01145 [Chromatium okenii]|uniref:hypothetical protein n=1 Tax=Chromatium okenii TaxID=61644 RepID=UPI0019078FB3|nr:hypothetical protein [Chromatium okenii]MBK1640504.1 hypothetical protein [Chromatium okenii]
MPVDVWLWPEAGAVRWWQAAETCLFPDLSPQTAPVCPAFAPLRARRLCQHQECWALETALVPSFAARLRASVQRQPVRLHLHPQLATSWQHFPFEWLQVDGTSLHARLSVNRLSAAEHAPLPPLAPQRDCVICDLLPPAEQLNSPARLLPVGTAQIITGAAAVNSYLAYADLTTAAALCVIAHGTECAHAPALRLPDGTPWTLPTERGMPPLVLLLACGDADGNVLHEAQRLLNAGAQTVVAALGQPTLTAAGAFLRTFLPRWCKGERPDDLLREMVVASGMSHSSGRLLLLGRGDLRMATTPRWCEYADAELAAAQHEPGALTELVTRLTRRTAAQQETLDAAERAFKKLLGIAAHDESARRTLRAQLQPLEPTLPMLSRAWVAPLLAHFTEAYAHDQIAELKRVRHLLDKKQITHSLPLLHYWSKLYYRKGEYSAALQDLILGMQHSSAAEFYDANGLYRSNCWGVIGHLCNILVDLNHAAIAEQLLEELDAALVGQHDTDTEFERHKLLDRRARAALRNGNAKRALAFYQQKYRAAAQFNGDGLREIAGLIYISAWCQLSPPAELQQAYSFLATLRPTDIGNGNDTGVYLLRAVAAWGWLRQDTDALAVITPFFPALINLLQQGDAGPAGLIFSFLHFAQRKVLTIANTLPTWDEISVNLERDRYFIELAALHALMGNRGDSANYLCQLQRQRQLKIGVNFPDWLASGTLVNWNELCQNRAAFEKQVLLSATAVTPAQLRDSGLLPL